MKFWPFPLLRNSLTNRQLDDIFMAYLAQDDLQVVSVGDYRAKVKCSLGTMEFWCANRLYAYASEGKVENTKGDEFRWSHNGMPSRWACREMDKIVYPHQLLTKRVHAELFTKVEQ